MKKIISYHAGKFLEIFTIVVLLYSNTLMGLLTRKDTSHPDYSFFESLLQLLTWEIFIVAFLAGIFGSFLYTKIRRLD